MKVTPRGHATTAIGMSSGLSWFIVRTAADARHVFPAGHLEDEPPPHRPPAGEVGKA